MSFGEIMAVYFENNDARKYAKCRKRVKAGGTTLKHQ